MKKFFIIIVLAVVLAVTAILTVSCNQTFGGSMSDYEGQREQSVFNLIELSFEGHSHQFVFHNGLYDTTLDHWPSCKYCTDSTDTEAKPARQELKSLQTEAKPTRQELKSLQSQSVNLQYLH